MKAVIIPTIDQTDMVIKCIQSLYSQTTSIDIEIYVVDDGSTIPIRQLLQELLKKEFQNKHIEYVQRQENGGFPKAVNSGLRALKKSSNYSSCTQIIILNNDVIVQSDIFSNIEEVFKDDLKIGVIGACLIYPNGTIQHVGMDILTRGVFRHTDKGSHHSKYLNESRYCPVVTGAIFIWRKECFEDVGIMDENFFLSCDDSDYCIRAWHKGWRTFYSHKIKGIHSEGATRGNTVQNKQIGRRKEWFEKEKETIRRFNKKYENLDYDKTFGEISRLNQSLNDVNRPKIKVEIGSGHNPQPGYIHIDSRRLPQVNHVIDFEKQRLPFADNSVDEIINNHVIEHISWRSLPFVLKEWHRVLRIGGRVFLRTPDLEFICKTYLAGKTTPEWPGDEKFITDNLSATVTPAWWANIKFFAGQDYPENYHCLCFDFDMLKSTVEKFGFKNVKRLNIQPIYSPGEIQAEFFK